MTSSPSTSAPASLADTPSVVDAVLGALHRRIHREDCRRQCPGDVAGARPEDAGSAADVGDERRLRTLPKTPTAATVFYRKELLRLTTKYTNHTKRRR